MLKNIRLLFMPMLFCLLSPNMHCAMVGNGASNGDVALKRLVVTELRDETGSPDWRNQLIALGIANLVATELYKTGRYAPIEEKPEILQKLNELQALSWLNKEVPVVVTDTPHPEPPKLIDEEAHKDSTEALKEKNGSDGSGQSTDTQKQEGQLQSQDARQECPVLQNERQVSLFERFGCEAVAQVIVKNFKKSRVRSIGFISGGSTTIKLNVEVLVKEKDGGFYRGVGEAEGTTTAMAAMFQIQGDRISFDETTVGQATQKAVRQAVANLCKVER